MMVGMWGKPEGFVGHEWVIVTEDTNPARLVYRRAGFSLHSINVQAYRRDRKVS